MTNTKIREAIDAAGGPPAVAALLGVSVQAVYFWRSGKRRLPPEHCAALEAASGGRVTRRDLRPSDWSRIWPEMAVQEVA